MLQLVFAALLLLSIQSIAGAAFSRVAHSNEQAPGTGAFYGGFGFPSVGGQDVVFPANVGALIGHGGIFLDQPGASSAITLASTQDIFPGTTEPFTSLAALGEVALDANQIAFRAAAGSPLTHFGMFTQPLGGSFSPVVTNLGNPPALDPGLFITTDDTAVALFAIDTSTGNLGIYHDTAAFLMTAVDVNDINPSTGAAFGTTLARSTPLSLDNNEVAFAAFSGGNPTLGNDGLYARAVTGGTIRTIADGATAVPGGNGTFSDLFRPVLSGGSTAFYGRDTAANPSDPGNPGVYLHNGSTIVPIADTTTTVPGGGATFTDFQGTRGGGFGIVTGAPAFDGTNVAFVAADSSGGQALYMHDLTSGTLDRVIGVGDSLDGQTVTSLGIGPESLDAGNLAFTAGLSGGSGVYTAFVPVQAGQPIPNSEISVMTDGVMYVRDTNPPFFPPLNDPDSDSAAILPLQVVVAEATDTDFDILGTAPGTPGQFHNAQARVTQDSTRVNPSTQQIEPVIEIGARSEATYQPLAGGGGIFNGSIEPGPWITESEARHVARLRAPASLGGPAPMHVERMLVDLDGYLRWTATEVAVAGDPPIITFGDVRNVFSKVMMEIVLHRVDASGTGTESLTVFSESATLNLDGTFTTPAWANTLTVTEDLGFSLQVDFNFTDFLDLEVPFDEEFAIETVLTTEASSGVITSLVTVYNTEANFLNTASYTLESQTPGVQSVFLDSNGNPVGIPEPATGMLLVACLSVVLLRRRRCENTPHDRSRFSRSSWRPR